MYILESGKTLISFIYRSHFNPLTLNLNLDNHSRKVVLSEHSQGTVYSSFDMTET